MKRTEVMKRYEAETAKCAFVSVRSCGNCSDDYIVWLEAKAAAYDRLMKGDITRQEVASMLGQPIAYADGFWKCFQNIPIYDGFKWWDNKPASVHDGEYLPVSMLKDFDGKEVDSLTLPDGWEETK